MCGELRIYRLRMCVESYVHCLRALPTRITLLWWRFFSVFLFGFAAKNELKKVTMAEWFHTCFVCAPHKAGGLRSPGVSFVG